MKTILILCLCVVLTSCTSIHNNKPQRDIDILADMMQGSFSSTEQHNADTANYFDIRLHVVRIWKNNTNGYWFYVEQALATAQEKPYRQRVYHLTTDSTNAIESAIFTINNPLRFAGAWKQPTIFATLTPDSLQPRTGCTVYLRKREDRFVGATKDADCPSELRGATYATTDVQITSSEMISWDRGYNEKNEQVWGATKGGYRFIKDIQK